MNTDQLFYEQIDIIVENVKTTIYLDFNGLIESLKKSTFIKTDILLI